MKSKKITQILLSAVCVLALAACGANPAPSGPSAPAASGPAGGGAGSPASGANIPASGGAGAPEGSDVEVRGNVVELSDGFCVLSPIETDANDDQVAYGAAPGYEDPEKNITVHYQEGCVVQIAEFNVATGEKNLVDASVSDIQQYDTLIVCGEWAGERDLNAAAIYIARYQ